MLYFEHLKHIITTQIIEMPFTNAFSIQHFIDIIQRQLALSHIFVP